MAEDLDADLARISERDQDVARWRHDGLMLAAFHQGCIDGGISKSQAAILTRDYARYAWGPDGDGF